jgi:hypothetical protein
MPVPSRVAETRNGVRIAFDTNFRPRGRPDQAEARPSFARAFHASEIVLASVEDYAQLYGPADPKFLFSLKAGVAEGLVKLSTPGCHVVTGGLAELVEAAPVVLCRTLSQRAAPGSPLPRRSRPAVGTPLQQEQQRRPPSSGKVAKEALDPATSSRGGAELSTGIPSSNVSQNGERRWPAKPPT